MMKPASPAAHDACVPDLETGDDLRTRPLGVTLLACLQALSAVASGLSQNPIESGSDTIAQRLVFGAFGLLLAIGLWRLQRWAWVATMVWQGIGLAAALYLYFQGEHDYVWLAAGAGTVLYLNQGDVQRVFASRSPSRQSE